MSSNASGRGTAERVFLSLDEAEVQIVRRTVLFAARFRLELIAVLATRAGNGWLYPLLSACFLISGKLEHPARFMASSGISVLLAFSAYPLMKRSLARSRPCDYDASLVRGSCPPLDRYSCPSGHAMTVVAYTVPLFFAYPGAAPMMAGVCVIIGWSRVALGQHYVSDVLIGAVLGAAISTPVALMIL